MTARDTTPPGASTAARAARRLSQRSTEDTLRLVLAQVAETPGRLAELLDEHAEPLVAFDAARVVRAANHAAEQLFGHPRGALVGRSTDALLPARLRQPDAPPMMPNPDLMTVELPGLRGDDRELMLSWTFAAVDGARPPIFVMMLRARSEIDDALDALQQSEERFRLLVDGIRDHAVVLLDAAGVITTWNSGAQRIHGWTADEIIGQRFEAFFTAGDREAGVPTRNLTEATGHRRADASGWRVRKDGSRFQAEATLWSLWTREGALRGFAALTHDLTERRLAEDAERRLLAERTAREAAEAGQDRLRRLHRATLVLSQASTLEEVVTAVVTHCTREVDAAAGAVYLLEAEARALRLLDERGLPHAAIAGRQLQPLTGVGAAIDAVHSRAPVFFEDQAAMVARYPTLADRIRAGDLQGSVALPLIVRGELIGVLAFRWRERRPFDEADRSMLLTMAEACAQAIDRARLFVAERQARAEAEAASRAKDEFLAMLGHELRNPLAPISTAIQLMRLRGEGAFVRERDVIERQLAHITRLVDDLLDVSRITGGKLELTRQPVDVADILSRAVEMASPLLEQRAHQLTIGGPRGLVVDGDAARLAQVVANLLMNAAKYTPPRGTIDLLAERDGDLVAIRVRDDGDGIPTELVPHIFELFVQGKRSFDRKQGGLGIGLAVVKSLVTAHGGTVTATSDGPGRGSEFVVRLPVHPSAPARVTPPSLAVTSDGRHAGKRVLVVDDNRDSAELLATALGNLGYQVAFAFDGLEALTCLRDFVADAAVLDLGLPVMDGFELARRIRQEFAGRCPRLIALTGYGQSHDRERSRDAGFAAHLVKPVELASIIQLLESAES